MGLKGKFSLDKQGISFDDAYFKIDPPSIRLTRGASGTFTFLKPFYVDLECEIYVSTKAKSDKKRPFHKQWIRGLIVEITNKDYRKDVYPKVAEYFKVSETEI